MLLGSFVAPERMFLFTFFLVPQRVGAKFMYEAYKHDRGMVCACCHLFCQLLPYFFCVFLCVYYVVVSHVLPSLVLLSLRLFLTAAV